MQPTIPFREFVSTAASAVVVGFIAGSASPPWSAQIRRSVMLYQELLPIALSGKQMVLVQMLAAPGTPI
jgi:hypothetical protein